MTRIQPPTINLVALHHDADETYLMLLETHLAPLCKDGLMALWHRGYLAPGDDPELVFGAKLMHAHLLLLLISADFNSTWDDRLSKALASAQEIATRIIPVIVRPCALHGLPYADLHPLPTDGLPLVSNGVPSEDRFLSVATTLREMALTLRTTGMEEMSTVSSFNSIINTIAQLERERFAFQRNAREANRTQLAATLASLRTNPAFAASESEDPLSALTTTIMQLRKENDLLRTYNALLSERIIALEERVAGIERRLNTPTGHRPQR